MAHNDPFTASLHECAHQFIPHMTGIQCMTTIQYGNTRYTVTITKQLDSPIPYRTPVFVPANAHQASSPSVLGKRSRSPEPLELNIKEHRYDDRSFFELYPEFGHNFK